MPTAFYDAVLIRQHIHFRKTAQETFAYYVHLLVKGSVVFQNIGPLCVPTQAKRKYKGENAGTLEDRRRFPKGVQPVLQV